MISTIRIVSTVSCLLAATLLLCREAASQSRDGQLFDPGVEMTRPAGGAPDELAGMQYIIGQWDVDYRAYRADTLLRSGGSVASITFMNRGHAIMERWFCPECGADGRDMATLSFLGFNTRAEAWNLGVADGYAESISVSSGHRTDQVLVLHNAVRHIGAGTLTYYRTRYRPADSGFDVVVEMSKDYQTTWDTTVVRRYRPRPFDPDFLKPQSTFGSPAPYRDEHSAEFDFLIGTFDAPQELTLPDGRVVNFSSTTTAVYALGGNAILEFGWYDSDPNLPDAATSIIRMYNRAMRRWESLYMTNRVNGTLFFGGRREGDSIVLGFFETDLTRRPIFRFVFHDINEDGYRWYSESSQDRGKTFEKTWIIEATRKEL